MNTAPLPTTSFAAATACFGSQASSAISRTSFLPRTPPCALMSSTAMRAPRAICSPIAAFDPVIGPTTAILMSCARALCPKGPRGAPAAVRANPAATTTDRNKGNTQNLPNLPGKDAGLSAGEPSTPRNPVRSRVGSAGAVLLPGAPAERPVRFVEPGILPHHLAGASMEERDRHDEPENRRHY